MRTLSKIKIFISVLFLGVCSSSLAYSFDTKARAAYVIDQTSGTILLSKNADLPLPPASMSKLMTLYMTFEFIKAGRLGLDEKLPVSVNAANYTGSTMFLDPTDRVAVIDLIRGIIVLSGNDACAVLAEALSPDGTEAGFAKLMTKRAKQLGLKNSTFKNSNGWPANGHQMSVRDLGLLAEKLIIDFPEYYPMFAEQTYEFDGRAPANVRNRNPLLGLGIGADGLKTGHTEEAGYGLVGSAKQDGRRIIFVLAMFSTICMFLLALKILSGEKLALKILLGEKYKIAKNGNAENKIFSASKNKNENRRKQNQNKNYFACFILQFCFADT